MLEIPIQVTRKLKLAYIGTWLMMAGPDCARALTRQVVGEDSREPGASRHRRARRG